MVTIVYNYLIHSCFFVRNNHLSVLSSYQCIIRFPTGVIIYCNSLIRMIEVIFFCTIRTKYQYSRIVLFCHSPVKNLY